MAVDRSTSAMLSGSAPLQVHISFSLVRARRSEIAIGCQFNSMSGEQNQKAVNLSCNNHARVLHYTQPIYWKRVKASGNVSKLKVKV